MEPPLSRLKSLRDPYDSYNNSTDLPKSVHEELTVQGHLLIVNNPKYNLHFSIVSTYL